jgi:hypothetical protein
MFSARAAVIVVAAAISASASAALAPAQAAPARHALVIGNGTYATLPGLPACLLSAHTVAAALRGAGFDVVEREDVTAGGIDAAIAEAARQLAGDPAASAFVYVCSYATAFNDRPFLLPISANIARPADVLTQGVLAKSLLDLLTQGGGRPAVLALDVVPAPIGPATGTPANPTPANANMGLDAMVQVSLPEGLGVIAASQAPPPDAPTSLATSLTVNLKGTAVQIAPLLAAVQQQLRAAKPVTIAALHSPAVQAYLVGAPPSPPAPPPSSASKSAESPQVATANPPARAPTAAPTPALLSMPAEENMTEADRRRIQTVLTQLGYYDGKVDGVFGPDTRAAIRRYQHELGATMTGRLTTEQASKLAASK